jgi:hypothetical protein
MIDSQPIPRCHRESTAVCRVKQSHLGRGDCSGDKIHRLAMTRRDFLNAVAPNEMIGKVALSNFL